MTYAAPLLLAPALRSVQPAARMNVASGLTVRTAVVQRLLLLDQGFPED
jgi:hypothetical protein